VALGKGFVLPSARYVALGKETFADGFFAECSAKSPSAVVRKPNISHSNSCNKWRQLDQFNRFSDSLVDQ
jgi:hypothetical protein